MTVFQGRGGNSCVVSNVFQPNKKFRKTNTPATNRYVECLRLVCNNSLEEINWPHTCGPDLVFRRSPEESGFHCTENRRARVESKPRSKSRPTNGQLPPVLPSKRATKHISANSVVVGPECYSWQPLDPARLTAAPPDATPPAAFTIGFVRVAALMILPAFPPYFA